jgi:hypothetical protein
MPAPSRIAGLRKSSVGENIGAGFRSLAEMLKQWKDPAGYLGGQSEVVLPEILGDGDHGLELNVIPGHREAMNPESPDDARDSGFALRARE